MLYKYILLNVVIFIASYETSAYSATPLRWFKSTKISFMSFDMYFCMNEMQHEKGSLVLFVVYLLFSYYITIFKILTK